MHLETGSGRRSCPCSGRRSWGAHDRVCLQSRCRTRTMLAVLPIDTRFQWQICPTCRYDYSASVPVVRVPVVRLDLKENFGPPKFLADLQNGITGSHLRVYIGCSLWFLSSPSHPLTSATASHYVLLSVKAYLDQIRNDTMVITTTKSRCPSQEMWPPHQPLIEYYDLHRRRTRHHGLGRSLVRHPPLWSAGCHLHPWPFHIIRGPPLPPCPLCAQRSTRVRLFIVFTRSYMLTPLTAVTSALRTRPLDDSARDVEVDLGAVLVMVPVDLVLHL
jgi:hypothetical protein